MRLLAILGLAVTLALLAGCEPFSPEGNDTDRSVDLEEYGGYTPGDEAPGFGDYDLLSLYPDGQPFDDPIADHPQVVSAIRNGAAKHYALRIVWGNIASRDTSVAVGADCPVSDWSGSAVVDGGVIIVRWLIRFEPGDYIVRPRRGPTEVEWVSHTQRHVDGVVFHVIDVPDLNTVDAKNTITITTPLYSAEIPLRDLQDYRDFVIYDDCNKISVIATEISPLLCPRGFLEGLWIAQTDTSGYFKGVWIGNEGNLTGHVRGRYGIKDGNRVLYGKWISTSGRFEGLLRGTWIPLVTEEGPDGQFEGTWVDESLRIKGFFKGHYCICENDSGGFFHGRWISACR